MALKRYIDSEPAGYSPYYPEYSPLRAASVGGAVGCFIASLVVGEKIVCNMRRSCVENIAHPILCRLGEQPPEFARLHRLWHDAHLNRAEIVVPDDLREAEARVDALYEEWSRTEDAKLEARNVPWKFEWQRYRK